MILCVFIYTHSICCAPLEWVVVRVADADVQRDTVHYFRYHPQSGRMHGPSCNMGSVYFAARYFNAQPLLHVGTGLTLIRLAMAETPASRGHGSHFD